MIPPKLPFTPEDYRDMLRNVERSFADNRSDQEIAVALGILPVAQKCSQIDTGSVQAETPDIVVKQPLSDTGRFDVC